MPLVHLPKVEPQNEVSSHPWRNTIKVTYANMIKTAHNSINNPVYPKEKDKLANSDHDRVKFTVIGNRVTKEFIYCSNLVKGLHKYRWRNFEAPVIRALTGVEWPNVLRTLRKEYAGQAYCLDAQVAVLYNNHFLGGAKELIELIQTRYIYYLTPNYPKECVENFSTFVKASGRPCAYLHISIDNEHVGTMLFMLFADIVPLTCENFLRLCKTTKGGYSGTPIHRIVKDGWVQCGGFGLKDVDLSCENFIVPHDRRGVLAMANDGRHVDCSTQFFILLQPAPWMTHKYVAFGQLIDGASVLDAIEEVPTWYESPTKPILIHHTGILNLECQDIMINRGAVEYITGHIDDLITIGEVFMELIMETVWLEIEFRRLQKMEVSPEDAEGNLKALGATQRFMRKKSEIEKQLEKSIFGDGSRPSTAVSKKSQENNEFDVDNYPYEEYSYQQATPPPSLPREEKLFYLPLTDVPYPGDRDSTYDLKKLLTGDYCLESDLTKSTKQVVKEIKPSYSLIISNFFGEDPNTSVTENEIDSDEEEEIKIYLKQNVDRVSFAGDVVKSIAKDQIGMFNLYERARKSELITDDELRRCRLLSVEMRRRGSRKLSSTELEFNENNKPDTTRKQAGFATEEIPKVKEYANETVAVVSNKSMLDEMRVAALKKIEEEGENVLEETRYKKKFEHEFYDVELGKRGHDGKTLLRHKDANAGDGPRQGPKVRIAHNVKEPTGQMSRTRRPTGFPATNHSFHDENSSARPSVLARLFEDRPDEFTEPPTLKNHIGFDDIKKKNILLTQSKKASGEDGRDNLNLMRRGFSFTMDQDSFDDLLNLQHGKKLVRKISNDYVSTIDQLERKNRIENSLRCLEYAKCRPTISVEEYQERNMRFQLDNAAKKL